MNKKILHDVLQSYIDNFDIVNNEEHMEYYKWQICYKFPIFMEKALATPDEEFLNALKEVKKCTENIIDSYTQPLGGLVEFAKVYPARVKDLLKNLYVPDGGDLKVREEKIVDFFDKCNELMIDCGYKDSYLYKQNSHSVSALLFLNDPDNHFMYKASHCKTFADCVEFYDDWGTGDNIKLDVFHRMCEEVLDEINNFPELLATDRSRYDGRLKLVPGELHPDKKKHILLFDIIYCASNYDIYSGISYTKRNAKEKNLYLENKKKAEDFVRRYQEFDEQVKVCERILDSLFDKIKVDSNIHHKKLGDGIVKNIDRPYVEAEFKNKISKISIPIAGSSGIISIEGVDLDSEIGAYKNVLKNMASIIRTRDMLAKDIEKYEEYLD